MKIRSSERNVESFPDIDTYGLKYSLVHYLRQQTLINESTLDKDDQIEVKPSHMPNCSVKC